MRYSITTDELEKHHDACVILWSFMLDIKYDFFKKIKLKNNKYIDYIINSIKIKRDFCKTFILNNIPNISNKHILLIGCGENNLIDIRQYKKIIEKVICETNTLKVKKIIYPINDINILNLKMYWKIRHTIVTMQDTLYVFDKFKTDNLIKKNYIKDIVFNISNVQDMKEGLLAIKHGLAISNGIKSTKDLSNMPPNICNSKYLKSLIDKLPKKCNKVKISHIDSKKMKKIGMNAYLAVGKGSSNKPIMSIINYKNNRNNMKPIILIGKGLTFDSGGISIKPSNKLDEMKYDMCGAAAVYGVMLFLIELKLPIHVIGIIASCENMLSSNSFRPGDILTTLSGKTVEVINTDAEGRLVLCDVLTYIRCFNPIVVIDIATLTGSCVIALGKYITGMMSNYKPLAKELIKASKEACDDVWLLPIKEEFKNELKSNIADISNVGSEFGGAITAGCFLLSFVKDYYWAHLDIAGTAWKTGRNKNATGRPVALLSQFLLNIIKNNFIFLKN